MRTVPTRADRRNRTRAELIAVADRRFSADGYHATSLDAVADEAGFTKGAVYSNFSSKEDLFFAVYEGRVEQAVAHAREVVGAAPTAAEAVRALVAESSARRDRDVGRALKLARTLAGQERLPRERLAALQQQGLDGARPPRRGALVLLPRLRRPPAPGRSIPSPARAGARCAGCARSTAARTPCCGCPARPARACPCTRSSSA